MFIKRRLLFTVAFMSAVSSVHSQSVDTPPTGPTRLVVPGLSKPLIIPQRTAAPTAFDLGRPAVADPISAAPAAAPPAGSSAPWVLNVPKPVAAQADAASQPAEVDLSALRYFASQSDLPRVAAEIRLLRAQNPGWEPPEDLFSEVQSGEVEKPLWELYAKHDVDGLRAAMEAMHQQLPDWQPSTDLTNKIALTEARDTLLAASDSQQWGAVIDAAASNKMLMTCGEIDAMWRTAEALIRTGDETRALEAYRYILTNCVKPAERLATVQKASALLQAPDDLESLLQMGRRLSNGRPEFEAVRLDLLRRRIGEAASGKAGADASSSDIDLLASRARATKSSGDAQLLGWYTYSHKDFGNAETWFRMAMQPAPDAKAAEGLVLTLRDSGKVTEAQAAAQQYAGLGPLNQKLLAEVLAAGLDDPKATVLTADQMATLKGAIDTQKSADAAQSLGWHLFKAGDVSGAAGWFAKSADWTPNESAAVGLLVTAKRLQHGRDYATVLDKYKAVYPKIADLDSAMRPRALRMAPARPTRQVAAKAVGKRMHASPAVDGGDRGWDGSADAIVKTYEGGNYDQAVGMLDARKETRRSEPTGLSVVRGWTLYHKGDWEGAKAVFSGVQQKGYSRDAQEGLRVIELGYTNPKFR